MWLNLSLIRIYLFNKTFSIDLIQVVLEPNDINLNQYKKLYVTCFNKKNIINN